jgi:alkaline phosphatase
VKLAASLIFLPLTLSFAIAETHPRVRILLPERTRLLAYQRVDLVIEVRQAAVESLRVMAGSEDISAKFTSPQRIDLDCDGAMDSVYRADLYEFAKPGAIELKVEARTASGVLRDSRAISIQPFTAPAKPRNIILFIGDAMGNSYRDAARIVSRSVETRPGVPGMREGFFDRLMEMDQMPVTGLVMTYGRESLVPDSAETATHWSTGNKPFTGMLSAFPDGDDCRWRTPGQPDALAAIRDNPRIESLLEYLKRRYQYRTGNVSTAFITDATPAAQGSHVATRGATFEIARQYFEDPVLRGAPAFDLILGGGKEDFDPDVRSDNRDLVAEFKAKGFRFVKNATELKSLPADTNQVLGLFRRPNQVATHSSGLRATDNGNMDTAYDKLGLLGRMNARPGSEPLPDFGIWKDQPFLDDMTRKAIDILAGPSGSRPFALQVEGALIDKQSHPNHAAGTIWDTIELDKAVGVARAWAKAHPQRPTLILVTGDHDQTMSILGVVDVSDADLMDRNPIGETPRGKIYKDALTNLRSDMTYQELPPAVLKSARRGAGMPDYQDADGDGYPENRQVGNKGRKRIAVGFRTGGHAGSSLPITAEGPGAALFSGYLDQTEIFFRAGLALTQDTARIDALLEEVQKLQMR